MTNELKMYGELASWWPLLSSPADYAEESGIYRKMLVEAVKQLLDQPGLGKLLAEQPDRLGIGHRVLEPCRAWTRPSDHVPLICEVQI